MPDAWPLDGIRVFEFGSNLAGPYAGWILAQLGALVIKVERPEGDDARTWGPPFWEGSSTLFHAVNRDKQAISVDLKDPAAAEALRQRIIAEGDVVVQNMRPGALVALGFAADDLLPRAPRLVYCNMGAFGTTGPLKDAPAYDTLIQGFGGLMSVTGEEGRSPVRIGIAPIDMGTGMWCAIGVLAALYRRTLTGRGGVVDASLFETALGWMTHIAARYQANLELPKRRATAAGAVVPYQGYDCSDGMLMIAASNDRLFAKLATALKRPEWIEDPRFRTNPQRVVNRDELNRMLNEIFGADTRAAWQNRLTAAGVPSAPIQSVDEVLAHPQTAAIGMAQNTSDPAMKLFGLPLSFDGRRPPMRNLAPAVGEHNSRKDG